MKPFGQGYRARKETADDLGGGFGPDKERKLVVELVKGDLISLHPKGTRQRISVAAVDVYRFAIRAMASRVSLEKARNRKAKLADQRERRRIRDTDRKLSKGSL